MFVLFLVSKWRFDHEDISFQLYFSIRYIYSEYPKYCENLSMYLIPASSFHGNFLLPFWKIQLVLCRFHDICQNVFVCSFLSTIGGDN